MVPPPTLAATVIPKEEQLPQMAIVFNSVRARQPISDTSSSIPASPSGSSAISARSQSADELSRRGDAAGSTDSEWTAKSVAVTANDTRSRRKRRRVLEPDRVAPAFRDSGIPHASTGKGDSTRNRQHGIILHQDELTEKHKPFATQHNIDFRTTRLDTDIDALLNQALPDPLTTHDDPNTISIRSLKQLIARHRALLAARLLVAKRRRELDVERVRRVTIAEKENIWVRHLSKRFDLRADMISEVGEHIEFVSNGMTCAQVPDDWSEDDYETDNDDGPVNIGEQYHQVPSVDWRDEPVTKGLSIDEISDDIALIRNGKRHEPVIPRSPDLKLINEEDRILGDLVTTLVDIHRTCTPAKESVELPSTTMLSLYIASIQVENNEANKFPADPPYQWSAKIQADNDHHEQQTSDPDKLSPSEMDSPPKPDVPAPQLTQGSPSYQQEAAPDYPYPRHPGYSEPPPNTAQDPNAPPPPTPHYNYGYSQSFMQPPTPAHPPPPQQQPPYTPEYDYRQDPHPEARYMPIQQKPYVQAQHQHPQQQEYYHSYSLQQAPYPQYPHPTQMTPHDQPYYPPPPQQRQRQYPLPPPPPPPPTYQQQQGWHQQPSPPPQRYQSQNSSQQQQQQPPPPQQAYPPKQYSQHKYPRSQQASHDSAPPPPDYRHHSGQYYHPNQDHTYAPQQNYASPQNGQYGEHHYQHPPAPYSAPSTKYQYNPPYQPQYSYRPPPPPPPPHQGQRVQGEQYNYSHQQEYQYQQQYSHGGAQPEGYLPASYQHRNHSPAPPIYTIASQSTSTGPVHVKAEPGTASAPIVIHNGGQGYMPESRSEIMAAGGQSHGVLPDYEYSPDQQARYPDRWHTYPSRQSQQQQQYGGDTPRYEYSHPPEWSGPPGPTYQNYGPPPSRYGPPGPHYGEQYSQGTPNRLSRPCRP
ncbi:hypothetical protein V1515DRAFT_6952 [Lipomyces mesembrius]